MTAILTPTRFGPMLVPPYDVYLSQAMIRRGVYAPEEFATWELYIDEGDVVVDAGANFGAHTFAFAQLVGPSGIVFAIEPQRMLHHMLCGSIALNGVRNVVPHHVALGRDWGRVVIPPIDYGAQGNFGSLELGGEQALEGEMVPVIELNQLVLGLSRVDFIKIDVEGMELNVLEGGALTIDKHRPVMSIEADREAQVPALLDWLQRHDYRAWWHRPPLGDLWPNIVSVNLLALPSENPDLPEPIDHVEVAIP